MKRIFLGLFLLTTYTFGMENSLEEEFSSNSKLSAGRKFLVATKSIAHDLGCDKLLKAIEDGLGSLSESYKHNNTFARIGFMCELVPEIRQKSAIITARLSGEDLSYLDARLLRIQDRLTAIADNQELTVLTPLLMQIVEHTDSVFSAIGRKLASNATGFIATLGIRDVEHDLKEELLLDMFDHFERINKLVPAIRVDRLKRGDFYRMEEIDISLDEITPILRKAKIL